MKGLQTSELVELSTEDLQAKLAELREEQFRLRFRSATESIEDPVQFRVRRRDIARVLTVLRQRETKANGGAAS